MKVLLAAAEGENYFDLLDEVPIPDLQIARARTPEEIMAEIPDTEVLYGFPNAAVIDAATSLKWVQSPGAGVDWVARVPGLVESEIVVTNTRGAHAPSIAEHVFAMLLTFTRGIPQSLSWPKEHYWGRAEGYRALREMYRSTMGIIGCGAIGQAIARRALAFEMDVIAVDANPCDPINGVELLPPDRLDDLLARSDAVVVTVPYTAETHHLLNEQTIGRMRNDAYLIGISRGGIIEEQALANALREGRLAGAAIDVTETEPLPADSPLWDTPNLLITPHLAGASGPKEKRCVEIFRDNLVRYAAGEPMINVIDKRRGY